MVLYLALRFFDFRTRMSVIANKRFIVCFSVTVGDMSLNFCYLSSLNFLSLIFWCQPQKVNYKKARKESSYIHHYYHDLII